jgi:hypothetical protein
MEEFLERFKGKTSKVDKNGINMIISKPSQPIIKNNPMYDKSSRSSERPRMKHGRLLPFK